MKRVTIPQAVKDAVNGMAKSKNAWPSNDEEYRMVIMIIDMGWSFQQCRCANNYDKGGPQALIVKEFCWKIAHKGVL